MEVVRIILSVVMVVVDIALIAAVLLQKTKDDAMIALGAGNSGSFFEKNKGRSTEGRLIMITKIGAISFMVLSIALVLIQKFTA